MAKRMLKEGDRVRGMDGTPGIVKKVIYTPAEPGKAAREEIYVEWMPGAHLS